MIFKLYTFQIIFQLKRDPLSSHPSAIGYDIVCLDLVIMSPFFKYYIYTHNVKKYRYILKLFDICLKLCLYKIYLIHIETSYGSQIPQKIRIILNDINAFNL